MSVGCDLPPPIPPAAPRALRAIHKGGGILAAAFFEVELPQITSVRCSFQATELFTLPPACKGLNHSLQGRRVRAPDPINQPITGEADRLTRFEAFHRNSLGGPVLEEHEGRHRRDAIPASNVVNMVDVHFGESQTAVGRVFVGQFGEDWGNGATRRTPVGVEVDDDMIGRRQESI